MKTWITHSLQEAGWAPASVFLLSLMLGNIFHAYESIPGLDKTVHLAGGMAIAHFFAISIHHLQRSVGAIPGNRQLVIAMALTFFVALAWEGIELIGDASLNMRMHRGLTDTLLDILFGLLGALILLFFRADKQSSALSQSGNV